MYYAGQRQCQKVGFFFFFWLGFLTMSSCLCHRYRELGTEELKEKNLPVDGLSDVYDISLRISVIRSTSIITVKISRKVPSFLIIYLFYCNSLGMYNA